MTNTILHRGPNSEGWISNDFVDVAFRRLSIIDLQHGHQPAVSEDKSVEVFLNGEIYNHAALRAPLAAAGHVFNSRSDTEVLPHLYEEHGIDCLSRLNGMFAICVVDHKRGQIFLCRDRLGVKPLFYAQTPAGLVFASELKAILASRLIDPQIDHTAALDFIDYFCVPEPRTLVRGIHKLEPGTFLAAGRDGTWNVSRYYQIPVAAADSGTPPGDDALDSLLQDSVRLRLVADVPVGISLSGGLDSSLIASYAKDADVSGLMAFTVDFPGTPREERDCAVALARQLGLKHVLLSADVGDFMTQAARMTWFSDEPIADPAYFAAMKVAESAAQHVTVMLAGTGGDELFAGYGRYLLHRRNRILDYLPPSLARGTAMRRVLGLLNDAERADALSSYRDSRLAWHTRSMSNLSSPDRAELAAALGVAHGGGEAFAAAFAEVPDADPINQQLYCDTVTYLRSQLLPLLDRTTMSVSIEGREPLLDYRLVEAAFQIAGRDKLGGRRETKAILRRLARRRGVPDEVITRRKLGFPNPVLEWFDGSLGTRLPAFLLAPGTFAAELIRDWVAVRVASPAAIRTHWRALYSVLVLNIWHELFLKHAIFTPPEIPLDELFSASARASVAASP